MKKIFLLLLFSLNIFASTLEISYEKLNTELENISSRLIPQDKVLLPYLVLYTHDKLRSKSHNVKTIKAYTLLKFNSLQKNNKNITKQEIEKLKTLYINMITSEVQVINSNKKIKKEYSVFTLLLISLLSILITSGLSYFIYSKKFHKANEDLKMLIEALENKNTNLQYKLDSVSTLKESFFEESKKELEDYEIQTMKLKNNIKMLNQRIDELQEKQTKLD